VCAEAAYLCTLSETESLLKVCNANIAAATVTNFEAQSTEGRDRYGR
jgi:hypothetical protein